MNPYDTAPAKAGSTNNKYLSTMFNELTSSLYVLAVKLKGFHWNIIGNQFFPLHVQLDCQATDLLAFADATAEIIRQVDNGIAPISMAAMIEKSIIKDHTKNTLPQAEQLLPILIKDYKLLVAFCDAIIITADANHRQDLSDVAIGIKQFLNKYIWQYESASK